MKTHLHTFLIATIFLFAGNAYTEESKPDVDNEEFVIYYNHNLFSNKETVFQFSVQPFSLFREKADVLGLNIILWIGAQKTVCGVSFAGINSKIDSLYGINVAGFLAYSYKNYGISIAPVNLVQENLGVILGIINSGRSENSGVQIGLINESQNGLQIGLLNHNEESLCPWLPIMNLSLSKEKKSDSSEDIPQKNKILQVK